MVPHAEEIYGDLRVGKRPLMGLRAGLGCRGRELTAPIFILPGQAAGSICLTLGFGRTAAGRVGNGVGYNASSLRHSEAAWNDGEITLEKAGGSTALVQTQDHWSMEGRSLVREATLGEFASHPDFATHPDHHVKLGPLWEEREYAEGYQWGMAIDLNTCIGCNACVVACQSENNIPVLGPDQIAKGRSLEDDQGAGERARCHAERAIRKRSG